MECSKYFSLGRTLWQAQYNKRLIHESSLKHTFEAVEIVSDPPENGSHIILTFKWHSKTCRISNEDSLSFFLIKKKQKIKAV